MQSFITSDKDICCEKILQLLSKREISKKEYELVQKEIIANEIRKMDDKYGHINDFPLKLYYTDSYYDTDFYSSINYDKFMDTISLFDFSNYSVGEVKKLKR